MIAFYTILDILLCLNLIARASLHEDIIANISTYEFDGREIIAKAEFIASSDFGKDWRGVYGTSE